MKKVKKFIIVDIIIFLIKIIGGLLCHSYTMLASAIYELSLLGISLFFIHKGENKKYKSIISSLYGFIIILLGLGIVYLSVVTQLFKTSLLIILFVVLTAIIRYIVSCFNTNFSCQKKEGLLTYGKINSTIDFVNDGIILGALILTKISKWFKILKYGDILGTIIISLFVIYKGVRIILNSFINFEDKVTEIPDYTTEILKRDEVKSVEKLSFFTFGGLKYAECNLILKDGINMVDVNTFVLTLQDYLLKCSDVVRINLVQKALKKKIKVKVRSKKEDARNSGSRNSKTNTKKKNSKKKNKKR